jgi:hypothetical protein
MIRQKEKANMQELKIGTNKISNPNDKVSETN